MRWIVDKETGERRFAETLELPARPLDIDSIDLSTEDSLALIGKLTPIAAASLEYLMRNPSQYPSQAVAAAKIVLERKLGAVPDTMIQNNVQYIIKWED